MSSLTSNQSSFQPPVDPLAYAVGEGRPEVARLNSQHEMLTQLFGGLVLAPVKNPKNILDMGTGTEIWAHQMATSYPSAQVVGCDLRDESGVPGRVANYRYVSANVLRGLPFGDASFDYVHMRALWTAFKPEEWPVAFKELVRVTARGGWIESVEGGLSHILTAAPALATYTGWVRQLLRNRGVEAEYVAELPFDVLALSPQSLTNVYFFVQGIPYGKQYGPIAGANETNLLEVCRSLKDPVVGAGLATGTTYDTITAQIPGEMATARCMAPIYVVYAQRV